MRVAKTLVFVYVALLTAYAGAAQASPNAADPIRAHGTVVIKTQQFETMIVVRTADDDGPADHVFHLWSRPALQLDGGWRNVGVEYTSLALALTFPESRKVLTFTVGGASASIQTPEGFSTTGYTVAGLSHEVADGATRHAIRAGGGPQPYDSCNCDLAGFELPDPWDYGASGGSCTSGGVFASSCSQSGTGGSCSVTCGTGTYACCVAGSPPTCTCKATL